jgi:hypothetical protein
VYGQRVKNIPAQMGAHSPMYPSDYAPDGRLLKFQRLTTQHGLSDEFFVSLNGELELNTYQNWSIPWQQGCADLGAISVRPNRSPLGSGKWQDAVAGTQHKLQMLGSL